MPKNRPDDGSSAQFLHVHRPKNDARGNDHAWRQNLDANELRIQHQRKLEPWLSIQGDFISLLWNQAAQQCAMELGSEGKVLNGLGARALLGNVPGPHGRRQMK